MKTLDRFVLRTFTRPFIITFFVMVLFLLMQFVWKYIDDLVGRGVEWYYIVELLFYTSATVVPLALPLAVLLSSIMVFGGLGEQNELAAMKASGISLIRAMRPVIFAIALLAVGAFFFSNYVIPVANLKSESLLRNISNMKPALNIRPGVFYKEIEGFSIKVGEKFGENQSGLKDVYIYDYVQKNGNNKVVTSETGKMDVTPDEKYLDIDLFEGNSYEDLSTTKAEDRDNYPFAHSSFSRSLIRFNLAEFQSGDLRAGKRKDFDMLNVVQLDGAIDSLNQYIANRKVDFNSQMSGKYYFRILRKEANDSLPFRDSVAELAAAPPTGKAYKKLDDNILENIEDRERGRVLQNALRIARGNLAYFENVGLEFEWRDKMVARHRLEWHKKFSLSFAVIVLFFIGAPLGAIIRKGGMGMPLVVSVIIFLIYHVTSYSFEKLGRELIWPPWQAMWMANMYLLPIGFFLTYKSATDSALFSLDSYLKPFQKIWGIFAHRKKRAAA